MDEYYFTLAEVLRERLDIIADHQLREQNPTTRLERLTQVSERIEQLKKQLPKNADSMFIHYIFNANSHFSFGLASMAFGLLTWLERDTLRV